MSNLKELVVISGKGGTGKTSITASLAALASARGQLVLVDADVDAPNLHLVIHAQPRETHLFQASRKAYVDPERCVACDVCERHCRFGAIHQGRVDPMACEGCGVCALVCPWDAIRLREVVSGRWFVADTRYGPMVHARMEPGEENSGQLVTALRRRAADLARHDDLGLLLIDGPPGIGCPLIAAVTGASMALVIAEPTVAGLHDLRRALSVSAHFHVPAAVCINRWDLYPAGSEAVAEECYSQGVPVVGRIPFDPAVTAAVAAGRPVVEHAPSAEASLAIRELWGRL